MSDDEIKTFTFGEVAEKFPQHLTKMPGDELVVDMQKIGEDFVLLAKMQGIQMTDFLGYMIAIWVETDDVEPMKETIQ